MFLLVSIILVVIIVVAFVIVAFDFVNIILYYFVSLTKSKSKNLESRTEISPDFSPLAFAAPAASSSSSFCFCFVALKLGWMTYSIIVSFDCPHTIDVLSYFISLLYKQYSVLLSHIPEQKNFSYWKILWRLFIHSRVTWRVAFAYMGGGMRFCFLLVLFFFFFAILYFTFHYFFMHEKGVAIFLNSFRKKSCTNGRWSTVWCTVATN